MAVTVSATERFADGLYGTGLRLQVEICAGGRTVSRRSAPQVLHLSAGCCDREIWARSAVLGLPRRVLVEVLGYVEGERAHAVRRAGRPAVTSGSKVRGWSRRCWAHGGCGFGPWMVGRRMCRWTLWRPAARRRLLVETADGFEPAALWLNEDGVPRDPHGWEHTFATANERLARLGFTGFAGSPHMMRHSFALRWYSVGRLLYVARFAYLTEDETRDFREQFGNASGFGADDAWSCRSANDSGNLPGAVSGRWRWSC